MTKLMEVAALLLLVSMFVMVGLGWSQLPERVPTHYNAAGEPDRWGSKGSVMILPAVGANLFLLLTAISWVAGRGKIQLNVPPGVDAQSTEAQAEARQLLSAVKLLMTATFAYITWSRITSPFQGLGAAFVPVMLILPTGVIGLYLVRMRRSR